MRLILGWYAVFVAVFFAVAIFGAYVNPAPPVVPHTPAALDPNLLFDDRMFFGAGSWSPCAWRSWSFQPAGSPAWAWLNEQHHACRTMMRERVGSSRLYPELPAWLGLMLEKDK